MPEKNLQQYIRKIIHIDMDAFFASVEQRDFPEYRDKPLVVGGKGPRSVVAAASYEARKYGIHSAMPMAQALKRCPHLVITPHRFDVYKSVSKQIREIFFEYTDLVEPLSLDEAFLDVTTNKVGKKSAMYIAYQIKHKIFQSTNLTSSAGVSINKFIAKVASGMNKPNGMTVILPEEVETFVANLEISNFFGVGKVTLQKMHQHQIYFGRDLLRFSEVELIQHFGKMGRYFYRVSRGIDNREVKPHRERKSISSEHTFRYDLEEVADIFESLENLSEDVSNSLKKLKTRAQTVQIKIRYADFETITRQKTLLQFIHLKEDILKTVHEILTQEDFFRRPVRLLGVGVSKLEKTEEQHQLTLPFD
jgi:DNA polymerase-4